MSRFLSTLLRTPFRCTRLCGRPPCRQGFSLVFTACGWFRIQTLCRRLQVSILVLRELAIERIELVVGLLPFFAPAHVAPKLVVSRIARWGYAPARTSTVFV